MKLSLNSNTILLTKSKYKSIVESYLTTMLGEAGTWTDDVLEIASKRITVRWTNKRLSIIGSVGTGVVSYYCSTDRPVLKTTLEAQLLRVWTSTLDKYTLSILCPPNKLVLEQLEVIRVLLLQAPDSVVDPVQVVGLPLLYPTSAGREWILHPSRLGTVVQSMINAGYLRRVSTRKYSITPTGYKWYVHLRHHLSTLLPPSSCALTPSTISAVSTIVRSSTSSIMRKVGFNTTVDSVVDQGTALSITLTLTPGTPVGKIVTWRGVEYLVLGVLGDRVMLQGVKDKRSHSLSVATIDRIMSK